jgi:hypothetical protein
MVDQLVIPLAKGWGIREATSRDVKAVFEIKEEAIEQARTMAKEQSSDLVIYSLNWKIEERESFASKWHPDEIKTEKAVGIDPLVWR